MKKIFFLILFSCLLAVPASAQTITDNHFVSGEVLNIEGKYEKDLFLAGTQINFSGQVLGDLFVFGQNVNIKGEVGGSIFFLASQINLDAKTGGSVRGLAQTVNLKNSIAHNATIFGSVINSQAEVGWHGYFVAREMEIGGAFQRLDLKTMQAKINAQIENDLVIVSTDANNQIEVIAPAEIGGNVDFTGSNKLSIADDVKIYGQVNKHDLIRPTTENFIDYGQIFWWLVWSFAMILVGLVMITWFGNNLLTLPKIIVQENYKLLLPGLIIFILLPIVAVLLFVSLIGIPLAVILFLFYALSFYLGQIVWAIWLGDFIQQKIRTKPKLTNDSKNYLFWCLVLGVLVWRVILSIPLLGGLLAWLFYLIILGSIWRILKVNIKEN